MNKTALKILKKTFLHFVFWFSVWFFFLTFFSVGSSNKNFIFWFSSFLSIIAIVSSYVFVYHLIPNYLIAKKEKLFVLYTFYALVFIVFAVLVTIVFGFVFFYNLEYQQMPGLTKNSGVILVCVFLIVVLASGLKILKHNYKSLEEQKSLENKILQTQLELKEQELKFLKMQIHPHFLFNTLNTLYGFALKKSDKAPEMILKLSNLLDYILYQINKPTVFLTDEINHISDYISLEKIRFQDSLQIRFTKENISEKLLIAPMLLLPFVENAFKHGAQLKGVLKININLEIHESLLYFTIENSILKPKSNTNGIGLKNIHKRLEMLYKNEYSLKLTVQEQMFKIDLKIPVNNE